MGSPTIGEVVYVSQRGIEFTDIGNDRWQHVCPRYRNVVYVSQIWPDRNRETTWPGCGCWP